VNDLKQIEDMAKNYDRASRSMSSNSLNSVETDPDHPFFTTLDEMVKQFVTAVQEVKKCQESNLKEDYITATSAAHARADALIEEIKQYDLLADLPDSAQLETSNVENSSALESLLGIAFPASIKALLKMCSDEVRMTAQQITVKGKLASGVWPPPGAAMEMLQATIPCAVAVKKLVAITKSSVIKARLTASEDRKKKDLWRKECLQNAKVKQLFALWEKQNSTQDVRRNIISIFIRH